MTIMYYYEHGTQTFVNFRYNGRDYTRRCNFKDGKYWFKFKGNSYGNIVQYLYD